MLLASPSQQEIKEVLSGLSGQEHTASASAPASDLSDKEKEVVDSALDEIIKAAENEFRKLSADSLTRLNASPTPRSVDTLLESVEQLIRSNSQTQNNQATNATTSSPASTTNASQPLPQPLLSITSEPGNEEAKTPDLNISRKFFLPFTPPTSTASTAGASPAAPAPNEEDELLGDLELDDEIEALTSPKQDTTPIDPEHTVIVKAFYKEDVRRITFDGRQGFNKLLELVRKIYPFEPVLKYRDDDCELITMAGDEDLNEALRLLKGEMAEQHDLGCIPALRVYVFKGEKKKPMGTSGSNLRGLALNSKSQRSASSSHRDVRERSRPFSSRYNNPFPLAEGAESGLTGLRNFELAAALSSPSESPPSSRRERRKEKESSKDGKEKDKTKKDRKDKKDKKERRKGSSTTSEKRDKKEKKEKKERKERRTRKGSSTISSSSAVREAPALAPVSASLSPVVPALAPASTPVQIPSQNSAFTPTSNRPVTPPPSVIPAQSSSGTPPRIGPAKPPRPVSQVESESFVRPRSPSTPARFITPPSSGSLKCASVSNATASKSTVDMTTMVVPPDAQFFKTWKIRNHTAEAWPRSLRLVFLGGVDSVQRRKIEAEEATNEAESDYLLLELNEEDTVDENEDPVVVEKGDTLRRLQLLRRLRCKLQAPASTPVPRSPLQPGDEVDVRVPLAAPSEVGEYKGYWRLQNLEGKRFGPLLSLKVKVAPAGEISNHGYSLSNNSRFSCSGSSLRQAFNPPSLSSSSGADKFQSPTTTRSEARKTIMAGDAKLTPQLEKIWAEKYRQLQERNGVISANAPKTTR